MAPSGEAYNVDWIFSNSSNVHVASHLDWLTSYHPFESKVDLGYAGPAGDIMGVGDVALPVKRHAKRNGRDAHATLKLNDVLYMPTATCNILGNLRPDGFAAELNCGINPGKLRNITTGATVGLLDGNRLFRLRLSGQSPKQTSLDAKRVYLIRANWSNSERQRWEAHKRQLSDLTKNPNSTSEPAQSGVPPYTAGEKQWLKDNHQDEFHFLRRYGYSIYDEKKRAEGRLLARAFMNDEDEGGSEGEPTNGHDNDDEDSDDGETFMRELGEVPESHFADYYFSAKELKYIKKHYSYSSNFLFNHGLKYYDDEDCKKGKAILKQRMRGGG